MYQDYKVVACVPAGRKRTMSLLVNHLRANRGILDGVQLWRNTRNHHDLEYINSLDGFDDFFKVMPLDDMGEFRNPLQTNTGRFYLNTTDADTIYIRFDDDIVYIHPDAIRNLVSYRVAHPEAFVVYPVIWNNAVVSALQQEAGHLDGRFGKVERYCMDPVGWGHPGFAKYIHDVLLDHIERDAVEDLHIPHFVLEDWLRMSVSCICWFGRDFAGFPDFPGEVEPIASQLWHVEEESWITEMLPKRNGRLAHICGDSLVCHFSFFGQRSALDDSDLLPRYEKLSQRMLHDRYYDLIAVSNEGREPYSPVPWWERSDHVYDRDDRPTGPLDMGA